MLNLKEMVLNERLTKYQSVAFLRFFYQIFGKKLNGFDKVEKVISMRNFYVFNKPVFTIFTEFCRTESFCWTSPQILAEISQLFRSKIK